MFNRVHGKNRWSPQFMLGVLAGAAAVGAYTISCGTQSSAASGTTGAPPPAASDIPYTNTTSGLGATTVQGALDEIGTTMRSATAGGVVTGGTPTSTTWAMEIKILDVATEIINTTATGTLTLTETAPGEGTYETSVANIFILDGLVGPPMGTRTGRYYLVGGLLMMTGQRSATATDKTAYTWSMHVSDAGRTISLNNFGSVTVVLTKS